MPDVTYRRWDTSHYLRNIIFTNIIDSKAIQSGHLVFGHNLSRSYNGVTKEISLYVIRQSRLSFLQRKQNLIYDFKN